MMTETLAIWAVT